MGAGPRHKLKSTPGRARLGNRSQRPYVYQGLCHLSQEEYLAFLPAFLPSLVPLSLSPFSLASFLLALNPLPLHPRRLFSSISRERRQLFLSPSFGSKGRISNDERRGRILKSPRSYLLPRALPSSVGSIGRVDDLAVTRSRRSLNNSSNGDRFNFSNELDFDFLILRGKKIKSGMQSPEVRRVISGKLRLSISLGSFLSSFFLFRDSEAREFRRVILETV